MLQIKKFLCAVLVVVTITANTAPVCAETEAAVGSAVALPIVMYHQLSKKARMLNDYVLSYEQFESDLKYLKENGYESVTVSQLLAWCDGEATLPEKPVMITFDDGYETTKVYAGPLLEKYGFTAVVAIVATVADQFTRQPDHKLDYAHLGWEDLREMSRGSTFEIQCHTYNMHKLSLRRGCGKIRGEDPVTYQEKLAEDLELFHQRCEENGVVTCGSIAFPYGFYCDETIQVVKEMGYKAAFTCTQRVNHLSGDREELYELFRFNRPTGKNSRDFFAKWN